MENTNTQVNNQNQEDVITVEEEKNNDKKVKKVVNAQEWLEEYYSEGWQTESIYVNQQLEGVLDCSGYKRLETIYISTSVDESKFKIIEGSYWKEKHEKTQIISCLPAQTWLDQNYPPNGTCQIKGDVYNNFGKTREGIKELDIRNKGLEGELDLSDFKNLDWLICSDNCLTNLNLYGCKKLRGVHCDNNQLTTLDLSNLAELKKFGCSNNYLTQIIYPTNPEKIIELHIRDNHLNSDLFIFSKFRNLEQLNINNKNKNKISQNIYNHFYGSLEPLKDLDKLWSLNISNTDIDSGREYLPKSIKVFDYSTDERPESKIKELGNLWEYYGEDLKVYKELINQTSEAQEWLDKNYPLDELCKNEEDYYNYNKNKREDITQLIISNQDLKGGLRLKGFTKLEELKCYNNQLTHLDLGDCENLKELNANNNNLSSLHFLKLVPKLERLGLSDNPNLPKDGLKIIAIAELKELWYLGIKDCPFVGSLEPLKSLSKLRCLEITNTDLGEGLDYLPEGLVNIECNSDHNHKSIQIVKELEKHLEDKKNGGSYYSFPKWLKNKRNSVATTVPLERLYVIRGNLMRFLNKWGVKKDGEPSEVSKLQDPNEISSYWYVGEGGQWISRATAVTGGVLAATTNPILGGVLAATSPVLEVCSSQLKERIYEAKEKQWNAYSEDLEDLLNSYHELLGIIETIVIGEKGEVNTALNELKNSIEAVLERYDEDNNRMVDIEELKTKEGKAKFAMDLDKGKDDNQLHEIIEAIEKVKEEVIKYHRRNERDEKKTAIQTEDQRTKLYQQIEKEVEEIKEKSREEKTAKEKSSLETKLKKAKINYRQTKNQLTNEEEKLLLLKEKGKLTNEKEELLNNKIKELKEELSKIKEEIDKNQETWWTKGKKILCCGKDKNESSLRETLSLENPEKQKELKEFIENQEEEIKEDHQTIDLDDHFEEKDAELIAQQEIPPK